jgi:two-component system nitrate/nitrite response regulator NarL
MTAIVAPATIDPAVLPGLDRSSGSHTAVLRVVVADDHPLFRQAVCGAIERHPGLALVGEAADGEEALALIEALEPDVAVLDHRMPGLSGAEVCEALQAREDRPATALLMLSAFEDGELVWGAVSSARPATSARAPRRPPSATRSSRSGRGGIAFTATTGRGISEGFAQHFGRSGPADAPDRFTRLQVVIR